MKKPKVYWVDYDLDGSYEFHTTDSEDQYPEKYNAHLLGPFPTFTKAKHHLIKALRHCVMELRGSIRDVKRLRK